MNDHTAESHAPRQTNYHNYPTRFPLDSSSSICLNCTSILDNGMGIWDVGINIWTFFFFSRRFQWHLCFAVYMYYVHEKPKQHRRRIVSEHKMRKWRVPINLNLIGNESCSIEHSDFFTLTKWHKSKMYFTKLNISSRISNSHRCWSYFISNRYAQCKPPRLAMQPRWRL